MSEYYDFDFDSEDCSISDISIDLSLPYCDDKTAEKFIERGFDAMWKFMELVYNPVSNRLSKGIACPYYLSENIIHLFYNQSKSKTEKIASFCEYNPLEYGYDTKNGFLYHKETKKSLLCESRNILDLIFFEYFVEESADEKGDIRIYIPNILVPLKDDIIYSINNALDMYYRYREEKEEKEFKIERNMHCSGQENETNTGIRPYIFIDIDYFSTDFFFIDENREIIKSKHENIGYNNIELALIVLLEAKFNLMSKYEGKLKSIRKELIENIKNIVKFDDLRIKIDGYDTFQLNKNEVANAIRRPVEILKKTFNTFRLSVGEMQGEVKIKDKYRISRLFLNKRFIPDKTDDDDEVCSRFRHIIIKKSPSEKQNPQDECDSEPKSECITIKHGTKPLNKSILRGLCYDCESCFTCYQLKCIRDFPYLDIPGIYS